jgi:gentisate 1,2-dioxygenase
MDVEESGCGLFLNNPNICSENYKSHEKSQNRRSMRRDLNLEPPKHDITFGLLAALRNRLQGTVYEAHVHSEHAFYYRHVKARLI